MDVNLQITASMAVVFNGRLQHCAPLQASLGRWAQAWQLAAWTCLPTEVHEGNLIQQVRTQPEDCGPRAQASIDEQALVERRFPIVKRSEENGCDPKNSPTSVESMICILRIHSHFDLTTFVACVRCSGDPDEHLEVKSSISIHPSLRNCSSQSHQRSSENTNTSIKM